MRAIVLKTLAAATVAVMVMAGGAFSAETAYVPFVVNVDAVVKAEQNGKTPVILNVAAGEEETLALPLGNTSVLNQIGGQGRLNAPVVTGSRGNIALRLPTQSYRNAEVALYAVNGKRILRSKVAASEAASGVSRRNVAAGVYMLSVKGVDGNVFTSRLTHSGGKMNINAAFDVENVSPVAERQFAKAAEAGDWDITVSAAAGAGYRNYGYALNPVAGNDNATQVINLTTGGNVVYGTPVTYGGESYQTVVIGGQTWLARNLNAGSEIGVCYNASPDSCAKYGRLYDWATAKTVCPSGWHLPSDAEWTALTTFVGSSAGRKLKSTTGWNYYSDATVGSDDFGFSALPGGGGYGGSFDDAGSSGDWWSATENDAGYAYYRNMYYNNENVRRNDFGKASQFSVRCVQD